LRNLGKSWYGTAGCWLVTVSLSLLVSSCDRPEPDYFPLNANRSWQYRVYVNSAHAELEQRHVVSNRPAEVLYDERVVPRQTLDGRETFYRVNDWGIERVTFDGGVANGQRRLPLRLDEDTIWQADAITGALFRLGPPQRTLFRITVQLPLTYRIEAVDERVDVPAGSFEHCVRVYGTGTMSANVGNYVGQTQITVENWDWYASGVGLVKSLRRETTTSTALPFGERLMELQSFEN
jgi:hypothetical protein